MSVAVKESPSTPAKLKHSSAPRTKHKRNRQPAARGPRRSFVQRSFFVIALAMASVCFCYPLVWMVSASLKPNSQALDNKLIPSSFQWSNYSTLFQSVPMARWFLNSLVVGILAAVTVTASSAVVAFAFAYFDFPGRNAMFALLLSTMMLPAAVTLVPQFLIWNDLGFGSSQVPLWAQNLFGSAFYIFMLRQFFLGLPRETFEAARMDGCSFPGLFFRIAAPLCKPAMIVVLIFEFRASWTDLMKPLIYLHDNSQYTIPRGLKNVLDTFGQGGESQWALVMAASVVATVPMLILFFIFQRHFTEGIATQGRKG